MIDPKNITKFDRTEAELEEFLLFCLLVHGKNATIQARKLEEFLTISCRIGDKTPFEWIEHLNKITWASRNHPLMNCLQAHKIGQYKRMFRAFQEVIKFKGRLSTVTVEELEKVYGIGPKTARFFILHSRKDQKVAVLDRHILRFMREMEIAPDAPKGTPLGEKYKELEDKFLAFCGQGNLTVAEVDLNIWKYYNEA